MIATLDRRKFEKATWDKNIQFIKDFNKTGGISATEFHDYIFLVCALEEDNVALDTTSGTSGYTITSSWFDLNLRKMTVEFERPLDVFTDVSFFLDTEKPYKIWI